MKIGFVGCGKMSSALVRGILKSGVLEPQDVLVSDSVEAAAQALSRETGANMAMSNRELVALSDAILLCVKPGDALEAVERVADLLEGKLLVSIVAGLSLEALEGKAGSRARVIRVMPNTPALVFKAASAYALGKMADSGDGAFVEKLFGGVGFIGRVEEKLLDAVTGLSGSGPAYAYLMIEALADGGVLMGLPRGLSLTLAAQTVMGAAEMVLKVGAHPAMLRDAVTSPGGTTIAGLEVLEEAAVRAALMRAVRAATERAMELGGR